MIVTFLYKCRQCGKIKHGSSIGTENDGVHFNARRSLIEAIMGKPREVMAPEMFELHTCGPVGTVGVCDLIGFAPQE